MPSVCRLSKGRISNIFVTVWCVKLKYTELVVGDVDLTKRQYLYPNATASTITAITIAATATKAKATTSSTTIITNTDTTATKAKGIKTIKLGNIETVLK